MITLTEWQLNWTFRGDILAHGYVTGHHRLKDGSWIHTSRILKIEAVGNGEKLIMHTFSGSEYTLMLEEMNPFVVDDSCEQMMKLGITEEVCRTAKAYAENKLKAIQNKADETIAPRELYVIIQGTDARRAYWKASDGSIIEIPIDYHLGMFQDSILITDYELGQVDFRYFPKWSTIEPYHWSDGLEAVWLDNMSDENVEFEGTKERILCPGRQCVRIPQGAYTGEGLMSPDAVNGKCMLSGMLKDMEEDA